MNKTGIEWCDYTWNPVTGCTRGCSYCYARRMAQRLRGRAGYPQDEPFKPTFHSEVLWTKQMPKKPSRIFVCSMGELFSPDVPDSWVGQIFSRVLALPQHTFVFLTKNPHLLAKWNPWPENAWVGASIEGGGFAIPNLQRLAGKPGDFLTIDASVKFISFEPLLYTPSPFALYRLTEAMLLGVINWLIIGAQSGPGCEKHWPRREWVDELVAAADQAGVPVFMKPNLLKPFPDMVLRQERPE